MTEFSAAAQAANNAHTLPELLEMQARVTARCDAARVVLATFAGLDDQIREWRIDAFRNNRPVDLSTCPALARTRQAHWIAIEQVELAEALHAVLMELVTFAMCNSDIAKVC